MKQYVTLFGRYGCELAFTRSAVEEVARVGMERGGGARGLRGVLEEVLADGMFEVPGSVSGFLFSRCHLVYAAQVFLSMRITSGQ